MKYIIDYVYIEESISHGLILMVNVIPAEGESSDSDISFFAFPFPKYTEQDFSKYLESADNAPLYWEPDEDSLFEEDVIIDEYGEAIEVYRYCDSPSSSMLKLMSSIDEYEEDYNDEEELEREEDLFVLDDEPETLSPESQVYVNIDYNDDFIDNDEYNGGASSLLSTKRYPEDEIKSMSIENRHRECSRCSKSKNLWGLIDFYTYFLKHGGAVSNEYVVPALAYLYGRTKDIEALSQLFDRYAFCLWELSRDSKDVTQSLLEISLLYPHISNQQISYLESLYNNPKYCEMIDDILYDKDELPRRISGITREELSKTNDTFSRRLIKEIYNCFILNQRAQNQSDDEFTVYYVYVRRTNSIIKKAYGKVGSGECVISGTLDMKSFIELVKPKYGKECADFFMKKVLETKPWYGDKENLIRSDYEWVDWYILTDIAKDFFVRDKTKIDEVKMDIALLYLKRLNKKR